MFDDDDDRVQDVVSFMNSHYEVEEEMPPEDPIATHFDLNIEWKRTFPYPKIFNNYDAWLAELYGRNQSGDDKYLVGIHARYAEKVGNYLLRKHYGFDDVMDLNLYAAAKYKLEFEKVVRTLRYDFSGKYKDKYYEFDVKCRSNPTTLDVCLNPSKLQPDENLLFVRVFNGITELEWENVGYITPEMFQKMFGNQLIDRLVYVPGYFAFNNTIEAYLEYSKLKNPATVPLMMKDIQDGYMGRMSRQEEYWVDQWKDVSQNRDVEYWCDLYKTSFKKSG